VLPVGFGDFANQPRRKAMGATDNAGRPVELGRYETPEGPRVLIGRRIEGEVHVFDAPCSRRGRRYFVEARFESRTELAMLVADYRRQAERVGTCPMSRVGLARSIRPELMERFS
jgi:hypothetical protein